MSPMSRPRMWSGTSGCSAAVRRRLLRFFFSSRRRHTRFDCDWSSDVCSSDLPLSHALPQWTQKLRTEELVDLLQDPMKRKELREEVRADRTPGPGYVGLLVHDRFDRIWLLRCPHDRTKEGLTIAELAARRGVDPWTTSFDVTVDEQARAA